MPLADKIMDLRKKQGWSQIDLADRLDVSRQSVSKWEMAQAVPELDKIIKMSELFAVTTDYLLKDDPPAPESGPADAPPPPEEPSPAAAEPEPAPEPIPETPQKPRRKKWPWVLAACLAAVVLLSAVGTLAYRRHVIVEYVQTESVQVTGSPAALSLDGAVEQTAISDPDAQSSPATEYVYEGTAVTAGGIDPETLAAMAAEYAPYGVTCDLDGGNCRWFLDGQPIRVFTDVLTSNGESFTGGDFQGVIRNFAGEGEIDVRTVRDYDHCDKDGCGTLLYVESCPADGAGVWTEHHAGDHHDEGQHE